MVVRFFPQTKNMLKKRPVVALIYGNGNERKAKLGSSYSEIQGKVNEMYRQGLVN